jgi:DNA-binding Xre family transcriptional regulator
MTIAWTLRRHLAVQHGIFSASQLQALIYERTGVRVRQHTLQALLADVPPAYISFDTLVPLCTALECNVCDFCSISPDHRHPPSPGVA